MTYASRTSHLVVNLKTSFIGRYLLSRPYLYVVIPHTSAAPRERRLAVCGRCILHFYNEITTRLDLFGWPSARYCCGIRHARYSSVVACCIYALVGRGTAGAIPLHQLLQR